MGVLRHARVTRIGWLALLSRPFLAATGSACLHHPYWQVQEAIRERYPHVSTGNAVLIFQVDSVCSFLDESAEPGFHIDIQYGVPSVSKVVTIAHINVVNVLTDIYKCDPTFINVTPLFGPT